MKTLRFEIITDIDEAKKIWKQLIIPKVIDDEWDFRYIFNRALGYELHFIAGYDGDALVGLLPLQVNTRKGELPLFAPEEGDFLEFFGGDDTDNNSLFYKDGYEGLEEQFFVQISSQAVLAPTARKYTYKGITSQEYEQLYSFDISGCKTYQDYLDTYWNGSVGRDFKQIRKIYRENVVTMEYGNLTHLQTLFRLNQERFGASSSFANPNRQQIFLDLYKAFKAEIITVKINGIIESVSFGIHYKKQYVGMNSGSNRDIPDVGKLSVLMRFEHAITLGCDVYEVGKGSGDWKKEFGFASKPQYSLKIN